MHPPTCVACPSIYFVVECTTISAPNSNGLQLIGVAKVLSTTRGIPFLCATLAKSSISRTSSVGLEIVSPKISFVLGLIAACNSASSASGDTKVQSIPSFFIVVPRRLYVPP